MPWLAWLLPPIESAPGLRPQAQAWWALRFTPCVTLLDEALLLEVGSVERLWGGRAALQALLCRAAPDAAQEIAADQAWATGPTALQALALLRLQHMGQPRPQRLPHDLPITTLTALRPHVVALQQLGCRTWGDLRALPRAGLARRFGRACLVALDQAWGDAPHGLIWITLPERFALELELPALAESAPALLMAGQHLLDALQGWLRARQQGVMALELAWRHDLRRVDGVDLPPWQSLELRTAQPLQAMAHLRRLLAERLAHQCLAAPVNRLALRSLQTAPLAQASASLLPPAPDEAQGEPWHQLIERLSARLGPASLQVARLQSDHRPECMQHWQPAITQPSPAQTGAADSRAGLWPSWLVRPPQPLALQGHRPCLLGRPLRLLAGPQRVEAGWWEGESGTGLTRRDYFLAHNAAAGNVWVFRDRATGGWFLQGVYG